MLDGINRPHLLITDAYNADNKTPRRRVCDETLMSKSVVWRRVCVCDEMLMTMSWPLIKKFPTDILWLLSYCDIWAENKHILGMEYLRQACTEYSVGHCLAKIVETMRRDGNVLICVDTARRVLELAQLLVRDICKKYTQCI